MEVIFCDDALKELYETRATKDKRYRKYVRDKTLIKAYIKTVNAMRGVENAACLRELSFLHYEQLRHLHTSSVRILNGRVERLIFSEHEGGVKIRLIEIDNTHYGNKH